MKGWEKLEQEAAEIMRQIEELENELLEVLAQDAGYAAYMDLFGEFGTAGEMLTIRRFHALNDEMHRINALAPDPQALPELYDGWLRRNKKRIQELERLLLA